MQRTVRLASLLLALVIVLAGCGQAAPQVSTPSGGGTLTRAMTDEPVAIDPHGAANSGLNLVLPYLFDTLVTRQADGKIVGLLAESWQVAPDGKSVDFKLKSGVKFHDGSPLNAEAVAFTFKRFQEVGSKSPIYSNIKEFTRIEAVDELTVRFHFNKPNATFLSTLAMPYAGILSPSAVQAAGAEMGNKPVGTGPFKFGEWKRGVSITLVRNPDYRWGTPEVENRGPVHIDKLVYKLIPDANTQLTALQAGDVDVIFTSEPSQLAKLEADKSIKVQRVDLDGLIYLGYNCAKAPFDDVKVRRALSHAINKEEIIQTALGGMGTRADTLLSPSMLGYSEEVKQYGQAYDVAKAKALLAEAGFKQEADGSWQRNGQRLAGKLLTSTRAPNDAVATVIQSQLKAIGVPVEIQQLDSAAVQKATSEGAFDLLLWRYEWNDPDGLNIFLASNRIRQTNRVFYGNPKVDALFEQGLREFDNGKRAAIYVEAQKLILADAPWQPIYNPVDGLAYRTRVQGIKIGALGRLLLNDVKLGN